MECYLAIKKKWNNAICSKMDGHRECHTEQRKSDRGEILYNIPFVESKKKLYKWTYFQSRHRLTDFENELLIVAVKGGGEGAGEVREFGMDIYTLLYLKWITTKD